MVDTADMVMGMDIVARRLNKMLAITNQKWNLMKLK